MLLSKTILCDWKRLEKWEKFTRQKSSALQVSIVGLTFLYFFFIAPKYFNYEPGRSRQRYRCRLNTGRCSDAAIEQLSFCVFCYHIDDSIYMLELLRTWRQAVWSEQSSSTIHSPLRREILERFGHTFNTGQWVLGLYWPIITSRVLRLSVLVTGGLYDGFPIKDRFCAFL